MTHDSVDLNWRVEALCTAARPAVRREIVDGWAMGFTGGRMRQANCVNPLRGPRGDPVAAIKRGKAFYQALGRTPLFRVPTIADEMETELDRFGYKSEGYTTTLFNSLELRESGNADTTLCSEPDEAWLAARQNIGGEVPPDQDAYCRMVQAVALPKMFAATRVDDRIASIAYGVVNDGILVLESVATDAEFRGRGLARRTLETLIAWSRGQSAQAACLQVEAQNVSARALYASLGFERELYRYHYRRRPA